jgi:hypothetical protein
MAARKRMYASRRPTIIAMLSEGSIQRFLDVGAGAAQAVSERVRRMCRQVAANEIENIANLMETEPMGLQFGLVNAHEPNSSFIILRARDHAAIAINPFRSDATPAGQTGVAMLTSADEAIAAHQRVAEANWRDAVKGPAGASRLRAMLGLVRV